MAIQRNNSYQLMKRLEDDESIIKSVRNDIEDILAAEQSKFAVINAIQKYNLDREYKIIERLRSVSTGSNDRIVLAHEEDIVAGDYGIYGETVHPSFVGAPRNVLNVSTAAGYVFRNGVAKVTIDDDTRDEYLDILKHDSILPQAPIFLQKDSSFVKMKIEFADSVVSDRSTNCIEFAPYLPGSFSIEKLLITPQSSASPQFTDKPIDIRNIDDVGTSRIILEDKIPIKSLEFEIRLKYKDGDKYPFGFKHIYLYDANINTNSFIVVRLKKSSYIDYISEDITLRDQFEEKRTTCSAEDIHSYLYYSENNLQQEIGTNDSMSRLYLAKNVNTIYIRIPLKTSLLSFEFNTVGTR